MGMARDAIAILLVFNTIIINPRLTVAQYPLPDLPVVDNVPNPKLQTPNDLPGPYGLGSQQPKKDPQEQKPADNIPNPKLPVVDSIPNPNLQTPNDLPGPYGMGSQQPKKDPQEQKPADNIPNPKLPVVDNIPNPKLQIPKNLPGPYGMGSQQPEKDQQEDVSQQKPAEQYQHHEQPSAFNMDKLQQDFYRQSCPRAEEIVARAVSDLYKKDPQSIAILLRLQFHDCFVGGCDASILLDSTETLEKVEKTAAANGLLLKGADLIDDIKNMLEQECPETVSCADTLAFAAHEARVLAGLPRAQQLGGRRDSMISLATNVEIPHSLPLPFWDLDQMLELFQRKGFTAEDMVVLIGAHSIGGAHCEVIRERTFNFKNTNKPDPLIEQGFLAKLQGVCKLPGPGLPTPGEIVDFDATPTVLDNLFYKGLLEKKALLHTDQRLVYDPRTAPIVEKLADDPQLFSKMFAEAITRMSALNVITGETGQVRRTCRATN